jgi:purine nucleoside permease
MRSMPASSLALSALALAVTSLASPALAAEKTAPKVLVITMFGAETKPWLEGEDPKTRIAVPGLSKDYPEVACDDDGLCVMTTSMGFANAASSVSAVVYSGLFDLKDTYFLIAGIAGVDPADGTLGSAHWARFAVDAGLRHDIDPRQIPPEWTTGALGLGAAKPGDRPGWGAGTEVYALDEKLLQKAYELSKDAELEDNEQAAGYRAAYPAAPGNAEPVVSICDTLSGDTYWHGSMMAKAMSDRVALLTEGKGNYCTTQMEDNASLTALKRAADAGLLRFERIAVLRTASNFDRESPQQTAEQSLHAKSGGFGPATTNAYRVGSKLADAIIADWDQWKVGVP